jgi:nitrate reductase gamma subunit
MSDVEFMLWARGPAFDIATVIMCAGIVVRVLEIFLLGRKPELAEARGSAVAGGIGTIFRRMVPDSGTLKRSSFTVITGWVFHVGLFIVVFLFVPHILVFEEALGLSWAGLPSNIVDAVAVVTIATLLAVLLYRLRDPVQRMLSGFGDYLAWFLTILPLVTGWLAFHRVGAAPPALIGIHIVSVELLMILLPFTKLSHAVTLWIARWYNGAIAGYKGIKS